MPPTDSATAGPANSSTSTTATVAPSEANRSAVARPIPPAPPVMTATLSTRRRAYPAPAFESVPSLIALLLDAWRRWGCSLRTNEDVLHITEGVEGVRTELAADAGLLGAAERGPVAHRGVRVDREGAGLDGSSDPEGPPDVAGPQRP